MTNDSMEMNLSGSFQNEHVDLESTKTIYEIINVQKDTF